MAKYKWPTFNQECSAGYVLTLPEFGRLVCLVSSHLSCSSLWDGLWDESEMIWQVVKWWLGLSNSRYKVKGKMIHFAWSNVNLEEKYQFYKVKDDAVGKPYLPNNICQIILQICFSCESHWLWTKGTNRGGAKSKSFRQKFSVKTFLFCFSSNNTQHFVTTHFISLYNHLLSEYGWFPSNGHFAFDLFDGK